MGKDTILVGLDIGTTKIAVVIGEVEEGGELKIIGVGNAPAEGLKRGVVVNLEQTINSIIKAVQDAELMAGINVDSLYAGIAGDHIRSINSRVGFNIPSSTPPSIAITASITTKIRGPATSNVT